MPATVALSELRQRARNAKRWWIYTLSDALGNVRYVGKTNNPKRRLGQHLRKGQSGTYLKSWLRSLKNAGVKPVFTIIDGGAGDGHARAEMVWIQDFREKGARLCNLTDGGDGAPGWVPSAETRAKISASSVGKVISKETRELISAAGRGRKHSSETKSKIGARHRGKIVSEETRARLGDAKRGVRHSQVARDHISAGLQAYWAKKKGNA